MHKSLKRAKPHQGDADAEAYGTPLDSSPDFLKDFARRDGLAITAKPSRGPEMCERTARRRKAFDIVCTSDIRRFPGPLEIRIGVSINRNSRPPCYASPSRA